jgi:dCMP deaminase
MKPKFIDYFMKVAELTATLSYAKRLQVGAVIVKGNQTIGTGYNGMPTDWENTCEEIEWCSAGGWLDPNEIIQQWPFEGTYIDADGKTVEGRYRLKTKPEVLHAETNAIAKVAQSTESSQGATLFCTHAPCIDCAKLIYQSGIETVYYKETYRSEDGLNFLRKSGINVHRHTDRT